MSASASVVLAPNRRSEFAGCLSAWTFKCVYAPIKAPEWLLLAALAAMLFRPPDLPAFPIDRVAFIVLGLAALLRLALSREPIPFYGASLPMLGLLLLGSWGLLGQPYDVKAWSVLAAKWIVPVAMFHIAALVFRNEQSIQKLEWFSVGLLLYLSLTALFSVLELPSLVFPKFILDDSIGIHADRARGPFLQAVANGVSLNILGIVAVSLWSRKRLPRFLAGVLLVTTPLALLATRTRAVWASAGLSLLLLIVFARDRRSRAAVIAAALVLVVCAGGATLLQSRGGNLSERLQDRSPVEFRMDMYRAGWQMFTEKPLLGWGSEAEIQPELGKRVSDFHPEYYVFHNTYLELAVERGVLGIALYTWLFVSFFRLASDDSTADRMLPAPAPAPFGQGFGLMWRVSLCVYLLNASVVVMNYQFLNAYIFTIAGVLAAQQRRQPLTMGGSNAHGLSVQQLP